MNQLTLFPYIYPSCKEGTCKITHTSKIRLDAKNQKYVVETHKTPYGKSSSSEHKIYKFL